MANGTSGLMIDEDQFRQMSIKEQNLILFRNTNKIEKSISWFNLTIKVTLATVGGLCAATTWLLVMHLK